MAARPRFPRLRSTTFPLTAAALLACALAAPSCGGGAATTSNTGGNGGNGGGSGNCPSTCAGDTPVCDTDSQTCVGCVTSNDTCGDGQYCNADSQSCSNGCKGDADCSSPLTCDAATHQCVSCTTDAQCEAGFVCGPSGQCVAGCSDSQPCSNGLACCGAVCTDLNNDAASCGMCGKPCVDLENAAEACVAGLCKLDKCDAGFADCNQNADDGCEWDEGVFGPCSCTPGATQDCYTGASGKDVGTCKGGISTCDPTGTQWGPCEGQVTPSFDTCSDGLDNDCDGTPDNAPDLDGDGWTPCQGDCCDVVMVGVCGNPGLVNPGAFEVGGNTVDDDCDGVIDNVLALCDNGLASNSATATDYAKGLDLCASTSESPADKKDLKWGVISAKFSLADGTGTPAAKSKSIRQGFGAITQLAGSSLTVLSTGVAAAKAAPNNSNPTYAAFQGGQDMLPNGTTQDSGVPSDWLAANNNNLPNAPGCPEPQGGTGAHDPVMLKIRVRAPTNAKSFSVSTNFLSSEYPEWVCSPYNDFFLTLLDSAFVPGGGQIANPVDKNLAFYDPPPAGGAVYPVGVNLATGNTGLFNQCQTSATGCGSGAVAGNNTCVSSAELVGTGFDDPNLAAQFAGDPAFCSNNAKFAGGGTGWLTTSGNVKPGETIELRFVVWDTGDQWYDSVALIDNFQWSLDASTPGTHE
jgi:hypothetical protein